MKKISAKNTLMGMILIPVMFSGAVLAQETVIDKDKAVKKPEAYGVDDRGVVARNTCAGKPVTGHPQWRFQNVIRIWLKNPKVQYQ